MKRLCCSWIEECELDGMIGVVTALQESVFQFDEIHLLYRDCLGEQIRGDQLQLREGILLHPVRLNDPESYREIYLETIKILEQLQAREMVEYHYHISTGNAHMATVAILAGKTIFPGKLYQSYLDQEHNIHQIYRVEIPLDLEEHLLPRLRREMGRGDILALDQGREMLLKPELLEGIYRIARYDIPVFILGEPGTERREVAGLIHKVSDRSGEEIIEVDCYSDDPLLGLFKDGVPLEGLNNSVLYLNEIKMLTRSQQQTVLQLLRGELPGYHINLRVIATSDQKLHTLVTGQILREELYYLFSTAVIKLPPLRERKQIINIADHYLEVINREMRRRDETYQERYFTPSAQKLIKAYRWPGNIDELYQTLKRAVLWGGGDKIDQNMLRQQMIDPPRMVAFSFEELTENDPVQLDQIVNEVKRRYIKQALKLTGNNKSKAAKMLGYKSHQSLDYDLNKLEIVLK